MERIELEPVRKRARTEDDRCTVAVTGDAAATLARGLLDALCDDELACVLSYLNTREAIRLSATCGRTRRLLLERKDAWGPLLDLSPAIMWDMRKPIFAWEFVETARMPDVVLGEWDRRWLCRFKRLRVVYARYFSVDMPDMLGRLERLELRGSGRNTLQTGCGLFSQLVNLTSLVVSHMRLDSMSMESILTLPELRHLVLGPGAYAARELCDPGGVDVAPIETLDISVCDDHGAVDICAYLVRMPIRKLTCRDDTRVYDGTVDSIFRILRNINTETIEEVAIFDNDMCLDAGNVDAIVALTNVRKLSLHVKRISDGAHAAIFSMPRLVELDMSNVHQDRR